MFGIDNDNDNYEIDSQVCDKTNHEPRAQTVKVSQICCFNYQ